MARRRCVGAQAAGEPEKSTASGAPRGGHELEAHKQFPRKTAQSQAHLLSSSSLPSCSSYNTVKGQSGSDYLKPTIAFSSTLSQLNMPHRRRSVDVGGLALALAETSSGYGWGGWEETEKGETRLVYLLISSIKTLTTVYHLLDTPKS